MKSTLFPTLPNTASIRTGLSHPALGECVRPPLSQKASSRLLAPPAVPAGRAADQSFTWTFAPLPHTAGLRCQLPKFSSLVLQGTGCLWAIPHHGCGLLLWADYSRISVITPCSPPLSLALLISPQSLLVLVLPGHQCFPLPVPNPSSEQSSSLLPLSLQGSVPTVLLVQPRGKLIQLTSPAGNADPHPFPCCVSAGLMSCVGPLDG